LLSSKTAFFISEGDGIMVNIPLILSLMTEGITSSIRASSCKITLLEQNKF
jgi:hypothetical protein